MSGQQSNVPLWTHWARFTAFMTERFLGGPRVLKLAWVINFQKTGTFFYILLLMYYYQNYSFLRVGGLKSSGNGRVAGADSINNYCLFKSIIMNKN